jgi:hypothetical protein
VTIDIVTQLPVGSGAALALYTEIEAAELEDNPLPNPFVPPDDWDDSAAAWAAAVGPIVLRIKQGWARQARAVAKGVVNYAKANAVVTTTIGTSGAAFTGLQTLPSPVMPGAECDPPDTPKPLTGSVS